MASTKQQTIKANRLIAAVVIVVIIIFATLLYITREQAQEARPKTFEEIYAQTIAGNETENNFIFNGFVFIKDGILWKTLVQNQEGQQFIISTHYNPKEVLNITSDIGLRNLIIPRDKVVITTDTDLTSRTATAMYEVGRLLGERYNLYNKPVTLATTSPTNNSPVVKCSNTTRTQQVIYMRTSSTTRIETFLNGCIHVTGTTEEEIVRAADKLVFILLDIIPEQQPQARDFAALMQIQNWKGDEAADGFRLEVQPVDINLKSISIQGQVNVALTSNQVPIYTWQTPLQLSYYNESGIANLYLSADNFTTLLSQPNLGATIILQTTSGHTIEANLTLTQDDILPEQT